MQTVSDLVKQLGGNSAVGTILGKGQTTVSEMKRRQSIPVRYWPTLLAAAVGKGLTLTEADLIAIHTSGTKRRAVGSINAASNQPVILPL